MRIEASQFLPACCSKILTNKYTWVALGGIGLLGLAFGAYRHWTRPLSAKEVIAAGLGAKPNDLDLIFWYKENFQSHLVTKGNRVQRFKIDRKNDRKVIGEITDLEYSQERQGRYLQTKNYAQSVEIDHPLYFRHHFSNPSIGAWTASGEAGQVVTWIARHGKEPLRLIFANEELSQTPLPLLVRIVKKLEKESIKLEGFNRVPIVEMYVTSYNETIQQWKIIHKSESSSLGNVLYITVKGNTFKILPTS